MHGVAGDEEGQEITHSRVVAHMVEASDLQAPLHLGVRIRGEVGEQVAAGRHVRAGPGIAVGVDRAGACSGHDRVLHVRPADDGGNRGIGLDGVIGDAQGRLLEQLGDHLREHLDVAEFLGCDAVEQILVLSGDMDVPGLEAVLHGHGDLTVLASQNFLELPRIDCVGGFGGGIVLEFLLVEKHCFSFADRGLTRPSWRLPEAII